MQMVANGYGITLIPQIAADVELRDGRVKFLRFEEPQDRGAASVLFIGEPHPASRISSRWGMW